MSTPRLIISDIDGTLASRGRVSDRTWAAVQAVQAFWANPRKVGS